MAPVKWKEGNTLPGPACVRLRQTVGSIRLMKRSRRGLFRDMSVWAKPGNPYCMTFFRMAIGANHRVLRLVAVAYCRQLCDIISPGSGLTCRHAYSIFSVGCGVQPTYHLPTKQGWGAFSPGEMRHKDIMNPPSARSPARLRGPPRCKRIMPHDFHFRILRNCRYVRGWILPPALRSLQRRPGRAPPRPLRHPLHPRRRGWRLAWVGC